MTDTVDIEEQARLRDQQEEDRARIIDENMAAAGHATTEKVQEDYFGFDESYTCYLPDGISFVQHKALNEGDRTAYLKEIQRDITFRKSTGDATMRMASGAEKMSLLKRAITGWNLKRGDKPVTFSVGQLQDFLNKANPRVIDLIHKDVTKANPWLLSDVTIEQIDEEMKSLQEVRDRLVAEQEGKADS